MEIGPPSDEIAEQYTLDAIEALDAILDRAKVWGHNPEYPSPEQKELVEMLEELRLGYLKVAHDCGLRSPLLSFRYFLNGNYVKHRDGWFDAWDLKCFLAEPGAPEELEPEKWGEKNRGIGEWRKMELPYFDGDTEECLAFNEERAIAYMTAICPEFRAHVTSIAFSVDPNISADAHRLAWNRLGIQVGKS